MYGLSTHSRRSRYRQAAIVYCLGALATIILTLIGGMEGQIGLPSRERLLTLPIGVALIALFAFLLWKAIPWLSAALASLFAITATIRLIQFVLNAVGQRFAITYWPPSISIEELTSEGHLLFAVNALITALVIGMLLRAVLSQSR